MESTSTTPQTRIMNMNEMSRFEKEKSRPLSRIIESAAFPMTNLSVSFPSMFGVYVDLSARQHKSYIPWMYS